MSDAQIVGLVTTLGTGHDRQPLLLGDFAGGDDLPTTGRVDRDGLFHEHVLAGLDRGLEVHRAEVRRRGDDHHFDVGVEQLLVGQSAPPKHLGHRRVVLLARGFGLVPLNQSAVATTSSSMPRSLAASWQLARRRCRVRRNRSDHAKLPLPAAAKHDVLAGQHRRHTGSRTRDENSDARGSPSRRDSFCSMCLPFD